MKIATWNINSLKVRLPQVLTLLQEQDLDILALQELKLAPEFFPEAEFNQLGYRCQWNGQKTYNGVALISRIPISEASLDNPFFEDTQKRVQCATFNDIRVMNLYCVNGQEVGSEKYAYKKQWFEAIIKYIQAELVVHNKMIILGDFNIAPTDKDVYDAKAWHEKIMCSSEERTWFQYILNLGFTDSLGELTKESPCYTWWDYRANGFKRNLGMRIDHILTTPNLIEATQSVVVDTSVRGQERPSDHAPVIITLR